VNWPELPTLRFGDVVMVKSKVTGWREWRRWCTGFFIRLCSTTPGEGPSVVNHVAMVLGADGDDWLIAEALGQRGFVYTLLGERYGDARRFEVALARRTITRHQRYRMVAACQHLKGKEYGSWKVAAHAADYALTVLWHSMGGKGDAYLFRRACTDGNYPMCSWADLYIYDKGGIPFKVSTAKGQPDDIWDECVAGPPWAMVFWTDGLNKEVA
jgi:hypothetical protein